MEWLAAGRMSGEVSDLALLAAARSGDPAAFSTWMERRRHLAFAYACAVLGNREEAEDVVQEAFVRAVQAYQRGGRPGNWEAWLMRVLRNLCTDTLRRRRRRPTGPLDTDLLDLSPTPEMRVVDAEAEVELTQAVERLPEALRVPLLMHFGARLTYREIALALGVRESTVIGRVASALRVLRRRFGVEGIR
jgi:RNA polymerase sigma-70 factor (ECF subfamily)